jgi:hypothetical protein
MARLKIRFAARTETRDWPNSALFGADSPVNLRQVRQALAARSTTRDGGEKISRLSMRRALEQSNRRR